MSARRSASRPATRGEPVGRTAPASRSRAGRRRAGAWAVLALLVLPLGLAACGRRGPPVAPERRLPAAVADLAASVSADGVQLTWTLPRIRVDRSPLPEVRRAEVYRRLEEAGDPVPPRPAILSFGGLFGGPSEVAGFERVADIRIAEPAPAVVAGRQVAYTDTRDLTVGRRYTYVVIAVDAQGRHGPPSNRVVVVVAAAPRAPGGLRADPGDSQVRLAWEAPSGLEDGSPAPADLVYEVFRATSPEVRPTRPVNPEPLTAPGYVDLTVENERTYYYAVRARRGIGGPVGRLTDVAAATPEDRTPPEGPSGLVAVVAGQTVRLAWQPVADRDLAGYHVYRSTTAGRGHVRLTTAPQPDATFTDATVEPGQTYHYVVTAVDRAPRANESVPSAEAAARLP